MPGVATKITEINAGVSADIGAITDTATIDPTEEKSIIAILKGLLKQLQGDGSGIETPISTTHHSTATATANGTVADLGGKKKILVLQIEGSPTSSTIDFLSSQDGTNYRDIKGVRLSDSSTSTSTTTTGEIWQFDVIGIDKFMADLSAITAGDGSITVTSTAI